MPIRADVRCRVDLARRCRPGHVNAAYGQLPLSFEANQGQADAQVNFLSRGSGYTLFLTPDAAVMDLQQRARGTTPSLRMQLVGANPRHRPSA